MANSDKFELPQNVVIEESPERPNYAKFITEPWERGFGHTVGNAMRRVILTAMEGVAVSSVRIDGVFHEFCTMPDVSEDVMEIILNIKKLKFNCSGQLPRKLELVANQAGVVTAAAIQTDSVTTVLNPEQVICTLDKDREIRMELEIDRGRGYRPSEENKREDQAIGTIPVDSLFSPIERVRYDVQDCRVGQHTDYDRLEMEVWTDGRIDAKTAVRQAAELLRKHFLVFLDRDSVSDDDIIGVNLNDEDREMVAKLMTSVDNMQLSVRSVNCLNTAQIHRVGELVEKSENQMLRYRNFGKKSLQEIREKLLEMGLGLEMVLKDNVKAELARLTAAQQTQNNTEE